MKYKTFVESNIFLNSGEFDRMGSEFDLVLNQSDVSQSEYDKAFEKWLNVKTKAEAIKLIKQYS